MNRILNFLKRLVLHHYAYSDRDLTFILQVYRDYDRALSALKRVRRFYPKSRLIVLSDGDPDPRYKNFTALFQAEYFEQDRLYEIRNGGRLLHAWLEYYMKRPTPYLIRIDTDTRFDRRFHYLPIPTGCDVFGCMQAYETHRGLQGGCIIFSCKAAQKLFASKVFLSEELKDHRSWGRYSTQDLLEDRIQQGLIATDKVLHWAFVKEKIRIFNFPEIYFAWKIGHPNLQMRFAVVHPDKAMRDLS
jgi:hypothetical protein